MTPWALVIVIAAACSADSTAAGHAHALSLCALCDDDAQCETGICREYGDGYRKCSTTCTPGELAPQCSAPSSGSCNGMGYCMCAPYQAPVDADTSGVPKDAPMAPSD